MNQNLMPPGCSQNKKIQQKLHSMSIIYFFDLTGTLQWLNHCWRKYFFCCCVQKILFNEHHRVYWLALMS